MNIRFLSVCSGLEGASLAFDSLGWTAAGFAEIEAFPAAILAERFGSNLPGEPLSGNAPPNFGDFTRIPFDQLGPVDVLVGGTPCQAFSIAGKRLSLADARGNLTLAYAVLAHELARSHGLRNCLWENVPGSLSTSDNAFGCFLGSLVGGDDPIEPVAKPARGKSNAFWRWRNSGIDVDDDGNEISVEEGHITRWPRAGMVAGPVCRAAWRVLDAQYFGLAQRRARVFVVADFGSGADPAAVLFEPVGLQGNPAPSRKTGERIAGVATRGFGGGGAGGDVISSEIAPTLGANSYSPTKSKGGDQEIEFCIAHALRGEGFTNSHANAGVMPAIAFQTRGSKLDVGEISGTLGTNCDRASGGAPMVARRDSFAFDLRGREGGAMPEGPHDTANIRAASGGSSRSYMATIQGNLIGRDTGGPVGVGVDDSGAAYTLTKTDVHGVVYAGPTQWVVRRLTPTECERLQGVPDGWTRIPWRGKPASECPDGNRYKVLGNSWAVPVVRWIATRIDQQLHPS